MKTFFYNSTRYRVQSGFTLVELVIAIVVISLALAGLMGGYSNLMVRSADPLIYQQAVQAANSLMAEVAGKSFPASPGTCTGAGGDRDDYDDVCDFNGYSSSSISDIAGNDANLTGYSVSVAVSAAGTDLPGLAINDAVRIDLTVSHPLNGSFTLSSYRVNY